MTLTATRTPFNGSALDVAGHDVVITGAVSGRDVVRISGKRIASRDGGVIGGGRLAVDRSAPTGHAASASSISPPAATR